jgi:hypothetical protein
MAPDGLVDIGKAVGSVRVWTPSGEYDAPQLMAEERLRGLKTYAEAVEMLQAQPTPQRPPTAGAQYQLIQKLTGSGDPAMRRLGWGMVTNGSERTDTLVVYAGGSFGPKDSLVKKWYDGFVVDSPEVRGGVIVTDERGVPKGRRVCQMALPLRGGYLVNMDPNFDMFPLAPEQEDPLFEQFMASIYGEPDARRAVSARAAFHPFIYLQMVEPALDGNPLILNASRGSSILTVPDAWATDTKLMWLPDERYGYLQARGAAERR